MATDFIRAFAPSPSSASPVSGAPCAIDLAWIQERFARTDGGAGGPWPTRLRRLKFAARCARHARAIVAIEDALRDAGLGRLVEADATIALRPLRSYLCAALDARSRARAVVDHYRWLGRAVAAPTIDLLHRGGRFVLYRGTDAAEPLEIALTHAQALVREGELALELSWHGRPAMALAFSAGNVDGGVESSIDGGPPDLRFLVGAVQGVRGADAALHDIASAMARLRPTALLVLALQSLGQAAGLAPPWAVAADAHVYAGYRSARRRVGIDYDRVWADAGAVRLDASWWQLPPRCLPRPETEVESRRRASHRRRIALRKALHDEVVQAAADRLFVAVAPPRRGVDNPAHDEHPATLRR